MMVSEVSLERALTEDEILALDKDMEEMTLEECSIVAGLLVESIQEGANDMVDTFYNQDGDFNLLNWTNEEVAQASLDLSKVIERGFELMKGEKTND